MNNRVWPTPGKASDTGVFLTLLALVSSPMSANNSYFG
jgi:hypothetical protein